MDEKQYEYTLCLRSKTEEKLPFQFNKMNVISHEILKILIENKKYEIKSDVCEDVFHIFCQYLNDGKNPEVNGNNFFELSLLANEFKLNDLLSFIKLKSTKWLEYEKYLEQQEQINSELQKNIQQLSYIIQEFSNKIKQLENQQIQFISQFTEQDSKIDQLFDEFRSQNMSIQANHQQEIENNIQELKDEIDEHQNYFDQNTQQLTNANQDYLNRFETINAHIESFQNQISTNRERYDELENLSNEKITLLSSKIDSLTQSFDTKLRDYISRSHLRSIFSAGQTSYLLSSYDDYSRWYYTDQGRKVQIDGNHGHALIAWGWKKALELI